MKKIIELMFENPELVPSLVPELVKEYKSTFYVLGKEVLNIINDYADNTEFFNAMAKIKKQMYDAYINIGFTKEEAIAFIINDNLKLIENIKKSK